MRRPRTNILTQVNRSATPRSPIRFQYLPLDEEHPTDPQDEYGLSKLTGEICAEAFAKHWGLTIVTLRPMWVCTGEEMAWLPRPPDRADVYGYIHVEDMARLCYLAATVDLPEASHTVLFATAADTSLDMPSLDYVKQTFPEAEVRSGLEGYNSLASGRKAKEVLGFTPEISWRKKL